MKIWNLFSKRFLGERIKVVFNLGVINVFRFLFYRFFIKSSFRFRRAPGGNPSGPYFCTADSKRTSFESQKSVVLGFGYLPIDSGATLPDWHRNILNGIRFPVIENPWYTIPDFGAQSGDIKGVWELSRLDWIFEFLRRYLQGDDSALKCLDSWLNDWSCSNPPYNGPNWKCGQEASIRVIHLSMAALLLGQIKGASPDILRLIDIHLRRIAPTMSYAVAQDNNHGTSEAAALFVGGSWLQMHGFRYGKGFQRQGLKWLENRVNRLIEADGSFSQYSATYHRVLLDTLSVVEIWRREMSLPEFSSHWYKKAVAATDWLRAMLQPGGDVPNVGANDGARLLPLAATDYRDFRPSVQLAAALFRNEKAIREAGEWDTPLKLLGIDEPKRQAPEIGSQLFDDGGYAILRNAGSFVLFRYPRFRFRPGQADALHVDLWLDGQNLLRDGGSFSYNTQEPWQSYFPGVRAHNTVQFDDREPMPRISRFLFGEWLKTSSFEPLEVTSGSQSVAAGYRDYRGARHTRRLSLSNGRLRIEDRVSGFGEKAVVRWRLQPGDWELDGQVVTLDGIRVELNADVPLRRIELVEGWESRYYGQKTRLPVLEVEVDQAGRLVTDITWNLS